MFNMYINILTRKILNQDKYDLKFGQFIYYHILIKNFKNEAQKEQSYFETRNWAKT